MDVNLILFKKDGTSQSFPIKNTVTVIGRRQDCDLCIPLMIVSRKHCKIDIENSNISVRDLQSRNGTFLNNQKIDESPLSPGDVIKVGPIEFHVQIDGVPQQIQAPNTTEKPPIPQSKSPEELPDELQDISNADMSNTQNTEIFEDFDPDIDFPNHNE